MKNRKGAVSLVLIIAVVVVAGLGCLVITSVAKAVYFASDKILLYENGKKITDSSVIVSYDIYTEICKNGTFELGQQFSRNLTLYKTNESNLMDYGGWSEYDKNNVLTGSICSQNSINEVAKVVYEFNVSNRNSDEYRQILKRQDSKGSTGEKSCVIWADWNSQENAFLIKQGLNPKCRLGGTCGYESYLSKYTKDSPYHTNITIPDPKDNETHDGGTYGGVNILGGRVGNSRVFKVDIGNGTVAEETGLIKSPKTQQYLIALLSLIAISTVIFLVIKKTKKV
ncbi:MAG: hypothetical protein HY093_01445 [Candidatus Liptonbacteria bacterium]|nr:hypothetical protein [Candidatus Liptonbacteria bacterium]